MHAKLNTFGLKYLLWLGLPMLHGMKNRANSVISPFLLIANSCKTKSLHVSFLSMLCNFKPFPYKCSFSRLFWIAQSVPLSTGWQTSEVLRIIFAIAIQLLQLKQTWWFPAHCSHIFSPYIIRRNSVCQSSSKWASVLGQDLARWRSALASLQALTWAWQIYHLGRAKDLQQQHMGPVCHEFQ